MHASGVHRFAIFRTRRVALRAPHLATLRARLRRAALCCLLQPGHFGSKDQSHTAAARIAIQECRAFEVVFKGRCLFVDSQTSSSTPSGPTLPRTACQALSRGGC